jgi:hypothetical protein
VPRYAAATDASTAELCNARLIIAREFRVVFVQDN